MSKSKKSSRAVSSVSASAPAAPRPVTVTRSATAEFNPDYSYVTKDLKRIGILAVSFISILVILSFFLR